MAESAEQVVWRRPGRADATPTERDSLVERGFARHGSLLRECELLSLESEIQQFDLARGRGGVRGLLSRSSRLRELAGGVVGRLASSFLECQVRAVKLTLFDKTPGSNWTLPLHQDRVIAVETREELENFGPWSMKGGQPHVQAPEETLSKMLAVRVHLDDVPEDGGALRVVPGSHAEGVLSKEAIADVATHRPVEVCPALAGDAFVMRPLLVHGSSPAERPDHRRVLHFEFASSELPHPLRWPRDSVLVPVAETVSNAGLRLKRIYEDPSPDDGVRILVERLWPRGLSKERAQVDVWSKETAPSHELRRWFDHRPERWDEFRVRYRRELMSVPAAVAALRERVAKGPVTLVFASKEERFNVAVALREVLIGGIEEIGKLEERTQPPTTPRG